MLIVAVLLIKNIRYFRFHSRELYIQIWKCSVWYGIMFMWACVSVCVGAWMVD